MVADVIHSCTSHVHTAQDIFNLLKDFTPGTLHYSTYKYLVTGYPELI